MYLVRRTSTSTIISSQPTKINFYVHSSIGTRILETPQPLKIASLSPLKVLEISCGENHSALVTEDGKLLTFGDGRHGKLCLDVETLTNHYTPVPSTRFRVRYLINWDICLLPSVFDPRPRSASSDLAHHRTSKASRSSSGLSRSLIRGCWQRCGFWALIPFTRQTRF